MPHLHWYFWLMQFERQINNLWCLDECDGNFKLQKHHWWSCVNPRRKKVWTEYNVSIAAISYICGLISSFSLLQGVLIFVEISACRKHCWWICHPPHIKNNLHTGFFMSFAGISNTFQVTSFFHLLHFHPKSKMQYSD